MDWFISLNPIPPLGLNHETEFLEEVRNEEEDLFRPEGKVKNKTKQKTYPLKEKTNKFNKNEGKKSPYLFLPWEIIEEGIKVLIPTTPPRTRDIGMG